MTDKSGTDLSTRLRVLQHQKGLTVQGMADICGIPKSSSESYMKIQDAKQPGLKALISIADGLGASLDWLVGRIRDDVAVRLTPNDYAIHYYSGIVGIIDQLEARGYPTLSSNEKYRFAARDMLEFLDGILLAERHSKKTETDRSLMPDTMVENLRLMSSSDHTQITDDVKKS